MKILLHRHFKYKDTRVFAVTISRTRFPSADQFRQSLIKQTKFKLTKFGQTNQTEFNQTKFNQTNETEFDQTKFDQINQTEF